MPRKGGSYLVDKSGETRLVHRTQEAASAVTQPGPTETAEVPAPAAQETTEGADTP